MKSIVVLASGEGTTFQSIVETCGRGDIKAEVKALVVDRPCGAIPRAIKSKTDSFLIQPINFADVSQWNLKIERHLEHWQPDLIVLAGYLRKLSDSITKKFANKIINVHPALLPKYGGKGMYGINIHKAVSESQETETGATVHYVNEHYDEGQIIAQKTISIRAGEEAHAIESKVKKIEKELLLKTIRSLIN